ncbi:aldolase/citrate lyase family protein [Erythrobacter sp.]|uniref:aldolase/citrate lyase family protein n=1 Tax=Erythrobacter sp. TaxID=1042 RepID=UPI00312048C3
MLDFSKISRLKGEFEAEGLPRDALASEVIFAARHGVGYLVKIGGCEAKSDIRFLQQIGVRDVVAPMIESGFAMSKYMSMIPDGAFDHIGVTIETVHAVERIEELLDAGTKLSEVTVGRTDLTASFGGSGVDSDETIAMVKKVAMAARRRGLKTTVGGSVGGATRQRLMNDGELRELIAAVETRKCVMSVEAFLEPQSLVDAFAIETALLQSQVSYHGAIAHAASERVEQINARL